MMPGASAPSAPPTPHVRRSWRALFDVTGDAEALARCWAATAPGAAAVLRPRVLSGAAVRCRPGTTDARVFDDTFVGLYHLPPVELGAHAVILDLGANVGYTAAHLAAMLPGARVVVVEMDGANAAEARANLGHFDSRCAVVHAAAWDRDGEIVYGGVEEWGFRVRSLEGCTPAPAGERTLTAPAISMNTLVERCGLDRIDYAKVDVEGAEACIVTPGADWLRRVRCIKVEHHPPATRGSMVAALVGAGFEVHDDERHPRCVVGIRP